MKELHLQWQAAKVMDMTSALKSMVSKKKRRHVEDGFNLDLSYINHNIIAMGFPAQHMESLYRNSLEHVKDFLEKKHHDHYYIYNLCSEKCYDSNHFHGRVSVFPFDDHQPPRFNTIQPFCERMQEWLKKDNKNVAVVHCKAGKGRTGVMICCYLLYAGGFDGCNSAEKVLKFYAEQRTVNHKGVTIPSQRRYISYFAQSIDKKMEYKSTKLFLRYFVIDPVPSFFNMNDYHIVIEVKQAGQSKSESIEFSVRKHGRHVMLVFPRPLIISGDIKVEFVFKPKIPLLSKVSKEFGLWFNTFFVQDSFNNDLCHFVSVVHPESQNEMVGTSNEGNNNPQQQQLLQQQKTINNGTNNMEQPSTTTITTTTNHSTGNGIRHLSCLSNTTTEEEEEDEEIVASAAKTNLTSILKETTISGGEKHYVVIGNNQKQIIRSSMEACTANSSSSSSVASCGGGGVNLTSSSGMVEKSANNGGGARCSSPPHPITSSHPPPLTSSSHSSFTENRSRHSSGTYHSTSSLQNIWHSSSKSVVHSTPSLNIPPPINMAGTPLSLTFTRNQIDDVVKDKKYPTNFQVTVSLFRPDDQMDVSAFSSSSPACFLNTTSKSEEKFPNNGRGGGDSSSEDDSDCLTMAISSSGEKSQKNGVSCHSINNSQTIKHN